MNLTVERLALLLFTEDRAGMGDNAARLFRGLPEDVRQTYLVRAVRGLTRRDAA